MNLVKWSLLFPLLLLFPSRAPADPLGICCCLCECTVTTMADCHCIWSPWPRTCSPNPCDCPMGACCAPDGSCTIEPLSNCQWTWLIFEVCSPNPCVVPSGVTMASATGGPGLSARPNPSSGRVVLSLRMLAVGDVSIRILNVAGALIRSIDAGTLPAGPSSVVWDGRDAEGRAAPTGLYLVIGMTPSGRVSGRVLLAR